MIFTSDKSVFVQKMTTLLKHPSYNMKLTPKLTQKWQAYSITRLYVMSQMCHCLKNG